MTDEIFPVTFIISMIEVFLLALILHLNKVPASLSFIILIIFGGLMGGLMGLLIGGLKDEE